MKANLTLIVGASAIAKAVASIKNRGAKLDADIQRAGLSVLQHVSGQGQGDTSLAEALVSAMPQSARKLALVEWMLAYGQLRMLNKAVPEEALRIKAGAVFKYEKERTLDLASATAKPWHTFKPEKAVSTAFDAQAAVASVLARMRGAAAKGMSIEHKAEALKDAQALVALLSAEPAVAEPATV